MLAGAGLLAVGTLAAAAVSSYPWLLPLWFVLGLGYSMAQTPSGRLLRRSAKPEDRPALFAAQFALSHACWLIAYPLAGWAGATPGCRRRQHPGRVGDYRDCIALAVGPQTIPKSSSTVTTICRPATHIWKHGDSIMHTPS